MREGRLVVDNVVDPSPGLGQVLVRTLACGICGSDLHALRHADRMVAMAAEGAEAAPDGLEPRIMDPGRDVVMGHEFSAEVIELGEGAGNTAVGDVVVSMPVTMTASGLHPVGYSNEAPGGYGELMVLTDPLCLKVPPDLDPRLAALTEPMAVGLHAVNRSGIGRGDSALVLGCGPIGLAVIGALKRAGIGPIVAADFSPRRRRLAESLGADELVDPGTEPAIAAWRRIAPGRSLHIYEAVGVPGMLEQALGDAPARASVLVVGVCMEPDTIQPMRAVVKELDVRFSFGYDPVEFGATLEAIATGGLDVGPLITGVVGVDDVPQAFEDLANPDDHCKILVEPPLA